MIRRQVFVDMTNTIRRPPGGSFPIKPSLISVATDAGEKPVQLRRVGVDSVGFENHGRRGHRAAGTAQGAILLYPANRVVAPSVIALTERRNRQLDAMKKVAPSPWV